VSWKRACYSTANVYYWAVRTFGHPVASQVSIASLDAESLKAYAEALSALNKLVAEARVNGELR